MSHEHEMSTYQRNGDRVDLPALLEIGGKFQRETDWIPPTQRAKQATESEADSSSTPVVEAATEAADSTEP